jgi:hypothetical protein
MIGTITRHLLLLSVAAVAWAASPHSANAACGDGASDCFFRAAGNWNTAATWSDTNGGIAAGAFPIAGDSVKCSTGAAPGTYVINVAFSVANFDMTSCPATVTLQHDAVTLTITGTTFTFGGSSMVYNPTAATRIVAFNPSGGNLTVTSSGKRFAAVTMAAGANTVILGDAMRVDNVSNAGSSFTLTSGTLDLSTATGTSCPTTTPTLQVQGILTNTGASTRGINMGAGCMVLTTGINASTSYNTTGSNYTMTPGTGTITLSQLSGAGANGFIHNSTSPGNLPAISILASILEAPYTLTYPASQTAAALSIAPDTIVQFPAGTTLTITAASVWTGGGYDGTIFMRSSVAQTAATLSGTITCSWCIIGNITAASGTATNSVRYGGTTGFNSVSGPSGGGSGIIGGGL